MIPLTFHWYDGAGPPLTGVAVNVTEVPAQTGFAEAEIVTETTRLLLITIITGLLVTGLLTVQISEDDSSQMTTSPFAGVYV